MVSQMDEEYFPAKISAAGQSALATYRHTCCEPNLFVSNDARCLCSPRYQILVKHRMAKKRS